MNHPLSAPERQAERKRRTETAIQKAKAISRENWSSFKCHWGNHADIPGGCQNDGSGCLCECHDPEEMP